MIPSFISSKSKLVEPPISWKKLISFMHDRLKTSATAKSKIISYGTCCAWTFYLRNSLCAPVVILWGFLSLEKISCSKHKTCFAIFSQKYSQKCFSSTSKVFFCQQVFLGRFEWFLTRVSGSAVSSEFKFLDTQNLTCLPPLPNTLYKLLKFKTP